MAIKYIATTKLHLITDVRFSRMALYSKSENVFYFFFKTTIKLASVRLTKKKKKGVLLKEKSKISN